MEEEQKKGKIISVRIPDGDMYLMDFLENKELFKSTSEGVLKSITCCSQLLGYSDLEGYEIKQMLDNLEYVRLLSLKEIADKFSENEWNFFADCLNGNLVTGLWRYNVAAFALHCKESIELENLALKWNFDTNILLEKIGTLTVAQIDALYTHIEEYWNAPSGKSPNPTESDLRIIQNY